MNLFTKIKQRYNRWKYWPASSAEERDRFLIYLSNQDLQYSDVKSDQDIMDYGDFTMGEKEE